MAKALCPRSLPSAGSLEVTGPKSSKVAHSLRSFSLSTTVWPWAPICCSERPKGASSGRAECQSFARNRATPIFRDPT